MDEAQELLEIRPDAESQYASDLRAPPEDSLTARGFADMEWLFALLRFHECPPLLFVDLRDIADSCRGAHTWMLDHLYHMEAVHRDALSSDRTPGDEALSEAFFAHCMLPFFGEVPTRSRASFALRVTRRRVDR